MNPDVEQAWALFDMLREGKIDESQPPPAVTTTRPSPAALRSGLYTWFRRQNGIVTDETNASHRCTQSCLRPENGIQNIAYGLFLCKASGNIHDCSIATRHPLVELNDWEHFICSMTGREIGANFDERVLTKRQDNGDGGGISSRGRKAHRAGEKLSNRDDDDDGEFCSGNNDHDFEDYGMNGGGGDDEDDGCDNAMVCRAGGALFGEDDMHPCDDYDPEEDYCNETGGVANKRRAASSASATTKRPRVQTVKTAHAALQILNAKAPTLSSSIAMAAAASPVLPLPPSYKPLAPIVAPSKKTSDLENQVIQAVAAAAATTTVVPPTQPLSLSTTLVQHEQAEMPASVLERLNKLSNIITPVSKGTNATATATPTTTTTATSVTMQQPRQQQRYATTASAASASSSSSSAAPKNYVDMKAFAKTLSKQLFSERTQRAAIAKCSKSAASKGKSAVRSYARLSNKQGIVPTRVVADKLRDQIDGKLGAKMSVRLVNEKEIDTLSTLVADTWRALQLQQIQLDAFMAAAAATTVPSSVGGSLAIVSTVPANNMFSSQRQIRLKQFYYGLVFLLRQGLSLGDLVVFNKVDWLAELPELSFLMECADTKAKHKLITDGRNMIVELLQNHQRRDVTLRTVLENIYPERYTYGSQR